MSPGENSWSSGGFHPRAAVSTATLFAAHRVAHDVPVRWLDRLPVRTLGRTQVSHFTG